MNREPCIQCGTQIAKDHLVSLKTVMLLGNLPTSEHVEQIVRREGIPRELAQEFVDHKMGHGCVKVDPPCPSCGAALKTWHATGCWGCDWRRDMQKQLPDYYTSSA